MRTSPAASSPSSYAASSTTTRALVSTFAVPAPNNSLSSGGSRVIVALLAGPPVSNCHTPPSPAEKLPASHSCSAPVSSSARNTSLLGAGSLSGPSAAAAIAGARVLVTNSVGVTGGSVGNGLGVAVAGGSVAVGAGVSGVGIASSSGTASAASAALSSGAGCVIGGRVGLPEPDGLASCPRASRLCLERTIATPTSAIRMISAPPIIQFHGKSPRVVTGSSTGSGSSSASSSRKV